MPPGSRRRFLRELPTPSDGYRSADELIAPLRMVKDETELEAIARTAEIVSKAIDRLPELAAPGVTEAELRGALQHALLDLGADTLDYILVQAGAQAASPHHDADETPLAEGESVLHILGPGKIEPAKLTPAATRQADGTLLYEQQAQTPRD